MHCFVEVLLYSINFSYNIGSRLPTEVQQEYSVSFPIKPCKTNQQYLAIKEAFEEAFLQSLRHLQAYPCFKSGVCKVKDITIPGCSQLHKKEKRSSDASTRIEFIVVFRKLNNTQSSIKEEAEEVLFNTKYFVSIGNFKILFNGRSIAAQPSSLKLLSSTFKCLEGYIPSNDATSCGKSM